jgi:hypothetical protein
MLAEALGAILTARSCRCSHNSVSRKRAKFRETRGRHGTKMRPNAGNAQLFGDGGKTSAGPVRRSRDGRKR